MSKQEAIGYWIRSAERDRQTALDFYKSKHYVWSLFIWQLTIERLFKALIVKNDKEIIPTHNLSHLSKIIGLEMTSQQQDQIKKISSFNIEARYDDYKENFYHKATQDFTQKWSKVCEELYQWLKNQL